MPLHQIVPSPSSALLLGVGLQFAVQLLDKIWQYTLDWPKITKNIALTFIKPNFLRKYESCCFSIKNFPIPKKHHSVRGCQVCISRYVQYSMQLVKMYLYVQCVLHKTYVTLYTVCVWHSNAIGLQENGDSSLELQLGFLRTPSVQRLRTL